MSVGTQFVVTATAGWPVKRNKSHSIDSWVFDALSPAQFPVASIGASASRNTTAARLFIPQAFKIAKVGVYFLSALNATSFNIAVGDGNLPAVNQVGPFDRQRNDGMPTAVAQLGNLVFDNDVLINTTNFPNMGVGGPGWNTFAPYNYDCVYIPNYPLTLRATTNVGGSMTQLIVSLAIALIDTNPAANLGGMPTVDF